MNPHQAPARLFMRSGDLPIQVINGIPGYINLLDALNSWQLVSELKMGTGLAAAASFKHVSPAGAAVAVPLDEPTARAYWADAMDLSPLATAYARARGADRVASFGDFVALSETVDVPTARLLRSEVSDGVIAPGFEPEALAILKKKQGGKYVIIEADPTYLPPQTETREVFGITFEQRRNDCRLTPEILGESVTDSKAISDDNRRDMLVGLVALKYTQSNSVCYSRDGQVIGMGAGQQSRILCTRLAGDKADKWLLRHHPKVLGLNFLDDITRTQRDNIIDEYLFDETGAVAKATHIFASEPPVLSASERKAWIASQRGVVLTSDGFIPFRDNIDRAALSGVRYIAQPGHSLRDDDVIKACNDHGIAMVFTNIRLFHH